MQEKIWNDINPNDSLAQLQQMMDWLRRNPGSSVRIPAGSYRLTSELARHTQRCVMTGEYGDNPENTMFAPGFAYTTGLDFSGCSNVTLLADGVTLLIDGFMEPVSVQNCEGVCVQGLTIDYVRRPYSRGTVEEVQTTHPDTGRGTLKVRFAPQYPVDERMPMPRYCIYSFAKGRFDLNLRHHDRRYLGQNCFLFDMDNAGVAVPGDEFYAWHTFHYRPAVRIEEAKDTVLRDVTIHSHCGMGIVGHRSENILLSGLKIVPAPGEHMSTNTDATHFTTCSGLLRFENCTFEGHGDDATNVHTFYHEFERLSDTAARGWVKVPIHSATLDYASAGDGMELVHVGTLKPAGVWKVLESRPDRAEKCCYYTFDRPLPENAQEYLMANYTRRCRVEFVNSSVRNHFARAVLIKTREALIENNVFEDSHLWAVHVAAEAWWYEGTHSDHIVVRNNTFRRNGFHIASSHKQVGGVNVEMDVTEHDGQPHGYVEVSGNTFELAPGLKAIQIADTKRVVVRGNEFGGLETPVLIENCGVVEQE